MNKYLPFKSKVIELRKQGKTYREIAKEIPIKIGKSTLSDWCQGIEMPAWYEEKVARLNKSNLRKAQQISLAMREKIREDLFAELRMSNSYYLNYRYDKEALKAVLALLYLGEGAKWKSHRGLMLGSSDPRIVLLYIKLLFACYGITLQQMKCRVCYRADQDIDELENYWSKITGISRENFYKTCPDARTIGKPTLKKEYMGVCVIVSPNTRIQLELDIIAEIVLESLCAGPIA